MNAHNEQEVPRSVRSPRIPWMMLGAIGGWIVVAAFVVAAFLESTDLLPRLLTSKAKLALTPLGLDARVERAHFGWLNRSLYVDGVAIQSETGGLDAQVQRIRLVWDLSAVEGLHLRQVHLVGGQITLSEAGLANLQQHFQKIQADATQNRGPQSSTPDLLVEGVQVAWLEGETLHDLGRIWGEWSQASPGGQGAFRWTLPARSATRPEAVAEVLGTLESPAEGPLTAHLQARNVRLEELAWKGLLPSDWATWRTDPLVGELSLDLHWQAAEWGAPDQQAQLQLRLRDGWVPLTPPGPASQHLAQLDLDTTVGFQGSPSQDWRRREAWTGRLHAVTHWEDADLRIQGLLGEEAHPESLADLWLQSDALDIGDSLAARVGQEATVTDLQAMLAPMGTVAVAAGIRIPADRTWFEQRPIRIPMAFRVQADGGASVAYVGGPNRREGGVHNLGFPRRVDQVQGSVVFIADPTREFSQCTGIYGVHGVAGEAPIRIEGGIWAPPLNHVELDRELAHPDETHLLADSRLEIRGQGLSFDEPLRQAFQGLSGVPGILEILDTYDPRGGAVDVALDFYGKHGAPNAANTLDIRATDLEATWSPFPIPLQQASAHVWVQSDGGHHETGHTLVQYQVEAKSPVLGAPLVLAGHALSQGMRTAQSWTRATIARLNLRSSALSRALQAIAPEVRQTFEHAHLAGYLTAALHVVQESPEAPMVAYAQASPEQDGLGALPSIFPIETSQLRGSITSRTEIQPALDRGAPPEVRWAARADILGVSGVRNSGFPLGLSLQAKPDGTLISRITTADVDVDSPLIVGAIGQYLTNDSNRYQAFDSSAIPISGRISGACELVYGPQGLAAGPDVDLNLELHLDRFGPGGTEILRDVRGQVTLSQRDGSWEGKDLTGILGETPVRLHSLRVEPQDGGTRVEVEFSADGIPIDRRHLEPFLEPELLRTLTTELDARGRFDLDHGKLTLSIPESGPTALRLQGDVRIHEAFIRLGLPVAIDSTRRVNLDLWYEGSHVRAMGTIEGLVGTMAERHLENASFQFTYVAPKLTIEEFDGEFEGGRLQSLGAEAEGAAGFLALDLVHPFRFSLSASMRGVDVGLLLAGVFNSDFANEGRLDGDIRLSGDVDHLTAVAGSGTALLSDSALWAIPVFQSLFSQLGFDTTATFKRMEARFRIERGRIDLAHMQIKSDLLSLLGKGWVDFEGDLHQDLEVRYSLVDRLGPITKLLYRIQNSLLRVSIRGDMARPRVHLGGLFSQFFRSSDSERQLPLPGLSDLPDHF